MEAEIAGRVEQAILLADKNPAAGRVRLDHQRHLPRFGEKMLVKPGVIMGQENSHARMRVIPANDFLAFEMGINLVMDLHETVLRESEMHTALAGMLRGDGMFDNDEL